MYTDDPKVFVSLKNDDRETFIELLEILFTAKDVKDDKRAATLLTKLDEEAFRLIRNLNVPDKPLTKSLAELKKTDR